MLGTDPRSPKALMLGALLLTTALAGCAGSDGGSGLAYASYEEAKNAPGETFEANNTDSPIKLKLLEPSNDEVSTGELDVVFLLYNSQTDEPVTSASFGPDKDGCGPDHSFCAKMPAMGHGTSPETSPSHVDYGVYKGSTTISMNGEWLINVNPQVDGQVLEYDVPVSA